MEIERESHGEKTEKMQAREAKPSTTNKGDQDWKRDNHPKNEICPRIAQYIHKRRPGLKTRSIKKQEGERQKRMEARERLAQ